jgi:hypothetical protein
MQANFFWKFYRYESFRDKWRAKAIKVALAKALA